MIRMLASAGWLGVLSAVVVACGGSSGNTFSSVGGAGGAAPSAGGSSSGGSSSSSGGSTSSGGSSSSSGGSVSSGGTGGIPLQDLPITLGGAACGKLYECCTAEERMANLFAGETAEDCTVAYAAIFSLLIPSLQASISAGRIAYHGDRLAACVPVLQNTDCATLRSGGSDPATDMCDQIIEPLVALGDPCQENGECIEGYCDGATADADGQCAARKADQATCADDDECVSDYCDPVEGICTQDPMPSAFCGG